MTLMEVKGHQWSNGVNYVLWLPYWSKEALMQAENDDDDDLDGGQRSSEVKWVNYVLWLPYLVKMMTMIEVKGHQRSNGVNYVLWLPYFVKRSADAN